MSEYLFPAQKDRCALCARPLDLSLNGTVVKGRALPWVFCSSECFRTYHGKDDSTLRQGTTPDGDAKT